jgi:hypothetical protein
MGERWAIHLYSNTPPHVEAPSGLRRGNRSELQLFYLIALTRFGMNFFDALVWQLIFVAKLSCGYF